MTVRTGDKQSLDDLLVIVSRGLSERPRTIFQKIKVRAGGNQCLDDFRVTVFRGHNKHGFACVRLKIRVRAGCK